MRKTLASLFIFVFALFGLSANKVYAKVITEKEGDVTIAKTEIINDDLFIGSKSVTLDGTVNGDVFIGSQSIKIGGTINGNLHIAANIININGVVRGNIYGGGQTVLVNGAKIGGSLLLGGTTITVDKDSVIGGSILAGAQNLMIDSRVARNVFAGTGNLVIGSSAHIGKDLYYASGENTATISPEAIIVGVTQKSQFKNAKNIGNVNVTTMKKNVLKMMVATKVGMTVLLFIGALLVGFVYLKLSEKHFTQTAGIVSESFWKSLGIGFLVAMGFIPAIIILGITVIGLPLAGLTVLLFLLYSCLAGIIVSRALGNTLFKASKKMPVFGAFALGLLLIKVVEMIPFVGMLTKLVVFWAGLGALTIQLFTKTKTVRT